jgi:hypothetical protein
VRRRLCNYPVQIDVRDHRLVRFRQGDREYEVTALLRLLAMLRPRDDVDTQVCQVRARSGDLPEAIYELRRDHGEWRLSAIWD